MCVYINKQAYIQKKKFLTKNDLVALVLPFKKKLFKKNEKLAHNLHINCDFYNMQEKVYTSAIFAKKWVFKECMN